MDFRVYQAFLIFAVFIASGISFLPGKFSGIFARITVAVVGIITFLLISFGILWGIAFSAGFGAHSLGADGPKTLGYALIAVYFAVCALSCLPIIPNRYLRAFGLGLHFVYLPIVVCLATLTVGSMGANNSPWEFRLIGCANELSLGLIYAMLWFRTVEERKSS